MRKKELEIKVAELSEENKRLKELPKTYKGFIIALMAEAEIFLSQDRYVVIEKKAGKIINGLFGPFMDYEYIIIYTCRSIISCEKFIDNYIQQNKINKIIDERLKKIKKK